MKKCITCDIEKPIEKFYKHRAMKDGTLNKCKSCCKKQSKKRYQKLSKNNEWMRSERDRNKEKYKRLNYKEKQKIWNKNKPWKNSSNYKNLSRNLKTSKGTELHHWSYKKEHIKDVIILKTKDHRKIHTLLFFNTKKKIFTVKETGELLDTKQKHIDFITKKGFDFKLPK